MGPLQVTTLKGHLEQGRLHYEVYKWLDSGHVEFRVRGYSRPASGAALLVRLGFALVGRTQQLRFYRRAGRRMQRSPRPNSSSGTPRPAARHDR